MRAKRFGADFSPSGPRAPRSNSSPRLTLVYSCQFEATAHTLVGSNTTDTASGVGRRFSTRQTSHAPFVVYSCSGFIHRQLALLVPSSRRRLDIHGSKLARVGKLKNRVFPHFSKLKAACGEFRALAFSSKTISSLRARVEKWPPPPSPPTTTTTLAYSHRTPRFSLAFCYTLLSRAFAFSLSRSIPPFFPSSSRLA